jgi:rare lipoprotein A
MAARRSLIKLSASVALLASGLLASTVELPMVLSTEMGLASVYAYSGASTASGETVSPGSLTAAHRTLPFGTLARVTNDVSGDWVVVRINDRRPFIPGRVIDLTPAGADAIGSTV